MKSVAICFQIAALIGPFMVGAVIALYISKSFMAIYEKCWSSTLSNDVYPACIICGPFLTGGQLSWVQQTAIDLIVCGIKLVP